MYYSQACARFLASESTEAAGTCDFEEEPSQNTVILLFVSPVHSDVDNFPVI